jgi:hypothetical protein
VIEYDPSLPGYKGRRVVQFKRVDTRGFERASEDARRGMGTRAKGSTLPTETENSARGHVTVSNPGPAYAA